MLQSSLRNIILATGLMLPIVTLNAQKVLADQRDFRVHNQTNFDIVELYVSDSHSDNWEENLIPPGFVLPGGNSDSVNFDGSGNSCVYDIKAVFNDGDYAEKYEVDLCQISDFTFNKH